MVFNLGKIAEGLDSITTFSINEATSVLDVVEASFEQSEEDRYVSKKFSPSGYVCARWKAYERLNDFRPRQDGADASTLKLFRAGNAVHDSLQQRMLADTGKLFGNWRCASCGHLVEKSLRPQHVCTNTKVTTSPLGESVSIPCSEAIPRHSPAWIYEEMYFLMDPFDHPLFLMSGYTDGIWVTDKGWHILEIKSSDELTFNGQYRTKHPELKDHFVIKPTTSRHPMPKHVNQGMFYGAAALEMARSGDLPLDPEKFSGLIVLYVCRNTFRIKEYHIDYTSHPFEEMKMLVAASKQAYEANNHKLAPTLCSSANSMVAKKCPLRYECFPKKKS